MTSLILAIVTGLISSIIAWVVVWYWYIPFRDSYSFIKSVAGDYEARLVSDCDTLYFTLTIKPVRDKLEITGIGNQNLPDPIGIVSGIIEAKAYKSGEIEILFGSGQYKDTRPTIVYRGQLHLTSLDENTIAAHAPYISTSGEIVNQDFRWTRINLIQKQKMDASDIAKLNPNVNVGLFLVSMARLVPENFGIYTD